MPPSPLQRLGLRGRLAALAVASGVLVSVAVLAVLPPRLDAISRTWAESRSLGIARVLGRACTVAVDFDDGVAAERILGDLEASRDAAYAVLLRADTTALATWGRPPPGLRLEPGPERVEHGNGLLQVAVPVLAPQLGSGTLVVGFDTQELEERSRDTRLVILLAIAGVLLLLGLPATVTAGHLLLEPLRRMTSVAARVAEGDAAARGQLPVRRTDELGALARAFDHMLERLYEKEAGMAALATRLEELVEARTAQLAGANREIAQRLEELRRTQEQLVTADRRITIGRLAAGITHEINNPLAYIKANLEFVREEGRALLTRLAGPSGPTAAARDSAAQLEDAVQDALAGVERARYIVRSLKNFSRTDAEERQVVSLAAALQAAVDMSAHEVKGRARLALRLGPVPDVVGHEVRLSQVFVNLLVNAAQSIPEGASGRNEVAVSAYTAPDGAAVIEVADTGGGIPPEIRGRLFEPFFTTKPLGVGTGLGLAISREIVERCGGRIEVESVPGSGSRFRVVLPPAPAGAVAAARAAPAVTPAPRRRTVLVVDDDPMVRAALERSLGRDHEIRAVAGGREALAILEAGARFDRILCDVQMPGMDGFAFRERLAERDAATAEGIVFMTGGTLDEGRRAWLAARSHLCLEKPLDAERLGRALDAT